MVQLIRAKSINLCHAEIQITLVLQYVLLVVINDDIILLMFIMV